MPNQFREEDTFVTRACVALTTWMPARGGPPECTDTFWIEKYAVVLRTWIPSAVVASMSQPSITYGSDEVPIPWVTPFPDVNSAFDWMRIGGRLIPLGT